MQPGAFFINAARGNLVDERGPCARRWTAATWAGAALDVGRAADQMPSPALARHPRVIATPHIGGLTPPAIQHQALETVAQAGQPSCAVAIPPGAVNGPDARRLRTHFNLTKATA
jgi:D-3-phosphoglycerate dehydrogenase